MPTAHEVAQEVWRYVMDGDDGPHAPIPKETAGQRLRQIRRSTSGGFKRGKNVEATVEGIANAINGLSVGGGSVDVDALVTKLRDVLPEDVADELAKRLAR